MILKLKLIIKKILPGFIIRKFREFVGLRKKYHALNNLDKKLEKYIDYNDGFFVELGANDGKTQSNTLYFEKYRNWSGVLIEPTPHNYLKCKVNRNKRSRIFCNACVSFDYKEKYVEIVYSDLMSVSLGLELDIPDPISHANLGHQFLKEQEVPFKFGAIARTLDSILLEANAPSIIDLLSLDVEGAELEVLKGIDFNSKIFKFMCIESRNLYRIQDFLSQRNYSLITQFSQHDYLFGYSGKFEQ